MKLKYLNFFGTLLMWILTSFATDAYLIRSEAQKASYSGSNLYVDASVKQFPVFEIKYGNTFHLISHGKPGELYLNGKWCNVVEIANYIRHKHFPSPNIAQLDIYGCEFGKGAKGKRAVRYLEQTLHVNVAASDNITGTGGDWTLEIGNSETAVTFKDYKGSLQYAPGDDLDGDGLMNTVDIDADNDGVLNVTESPACYYAATDLSSNVISSITSPFVSADDLTGGWILGGDIGMLHDNVSTSLTPSTLNFNFLATNNVANNAVFSITYAGPIVLSSVSVICSGNLGANALCRLEGSVNGTSGWVPLSDYSGFGSATKTFTVNQNTTSALRYYRIMGKSGNIVATRDIYEITSVANPSAFNASASPKPACTADYDSDGILNQFDLDSDNDGCSDAFEAAATANNNITSFFFAGVDVNADGLISQVDANNDGIPDYTSTYNSNAQNASIKTCLDSDGDTVVDGIDLDDDNDGILDVTESCATGLSAASPFTSLSSARTITSPGIYYFNIGGQTFSSYVDVSGFVEIAIDFGNGVGDLPLTTALTTSSRGILNQSVLSALNDIGTVRITSNYAMVSGGALSISTTNATVIGRINNFQPLCKGVPDAAINATWFGVNRARITGTQQCTTSENILSKTIAHACGDSYGITWTPNNNSQSVNNSEGDVSNASNLVVWVLGNNYGSVCDTDNDGIPNATDLDSDGDGCPDLVEAGVDGASGSTFGFGTLVNTGTSLSKNYAKVTGSYGNNGFANTIETNDLSTAAYSGTYTYSKATNSSDSSNCNAYKPDGGTVGGTICVNQNGQITFTKTTGVGPFTLVINGVTYSGITSGVPFNVTPSPTTTTTYNLTKIVDANGYSKP